MKLTTRKTKYPLLPLLLCAASVSLAACSSVPITDDSPMSIQQEREDACTQLQGSKNPENTQDVSASDQTQPTIKVLDTEVVESAIPPFDSVLKDWEHLSFFPFKAPTRFSVLACDARGTQQVLGVDAQGSASSMVRPVNKLTSVNSRVKWKWYVSKGNQKANTRDRSREDSPVRVVLTFDGDKTRLKEEEQGFLQRMEMLTRRPAPYATLMYSVGAGVDKNEIVTPPYSETIKIKAVQIQSEPNGLGRWHQFERNIQADFEKAFGEKPGRLMNIAIMGDADNTKESSRAYITDVELLDLQP